MAPLKTLHVRPRPGHRCQGQLLAAGRIIRCALGRSGIGINKREGDGKTPVGRFALLALHLRPNTFCQSHHAFAVNLITPNQGWCDAVEDRNYNRLVSLPYPASHEKLTRDDHLYDVFLEMDYNSSRRLGRGGSAIFFHLAHDDYRPTEGCVTISRADMAWLLPRIGPHTQIVIG